MARRPSKKDQEAKEKELAIKSKLDSILLADDMLAGLSSPEIPPMREQRTLDVNNIKSEVETEARSILASLSNFYNEAENLPDDHYIKKRQKVDALSISTMAFQIRSAQHVISKIIEEIDAGRVEIGLIQVLAQLQNQIMQMPKNFTNYMNEMEKTYKGLKKESEEIRQEPSLSFTEEGVMEETTENIDKLKVRGTKSLMESMQGMLKGQKIKDAEIVAPDDSLINPRIKNKEGSERFGNADDEDDEFEIDDELFD
jgi:hypothetical protein